jgi:putative transposase
MATVTRYDRQRIYPTAEQEKVLRQILGCSRVITNRCIEYADAEYKRGHSYPGYYGENGFAKLITKLKQLPAFEWLKDADNTALQNAAKHADKAYRNYFAKRAKHPKFKSKHDKRQSYTSTNNGNTVRYEDGKYIRIPKVGKIRFRGHIRNHERILSVTIELTPTGKWFASFCVEVDLEKRLPEAKRTHGTQSVGIDVGIRNYAVLYNGTECESIENVKALERLLEKLKTETRKLSRMRNHETKAMKACGVHSRNYEKQRRKVARIYERIVNIRMDYLNKLSRRIAVENQAVVCESLDIRGMLRNAETHALARRISDASWGTFIRMLEYKCAETGCLLIKAEPEFPSTQMCSYCGYVNGNITLRMRTITCPVCQAAYDRDENAARNLYRRSPSAGKGSTEGTAVDGLGPIPVETTAAAVSDGSASRCL